MPMNDDEEPKTGDHPNLLGKIKDKLIRSKEKWAEEGRLITGRPDLGMPDYTDPTGRPDGFKPLTDQDITNLAALLTSWRQRGSVPRKGD